MRCELAAVWFAHIAVAAVVCLGIALQFIAKVSPLKLVLLAAFNIHI